MVHDTLLEKKKKGLHLDIGQAIEEVHQNNLEEMWAPLAEHFEGGGDYEKAAQYFDLAAIKAQSAWVLIDAVALSKRRVACLEKLPQTYEIQKKVIDARIALANSYANHFAEAREAVAPIVDLVQQLDYRERLPAIYSIMASYLLMVEERYNDDEMHHYIRDARRLALEEKDYRSLWFTHYYEGIAKTFNCEFAEGEASFLRLMEMAEASGDLRMLGIVKLNISGYVYALWGRINQALTCGQEALQLAFQADDIHMKSMAYNACGIALCKKGLFLEAEENLRLMFEMTRKTDNAINLFGGFFWLGQLCFETGRYQEAQECCDSLLALYERVRFGPSWARTAQLVKVAAGIKGGFNPSLDAVLNFDLQEIKMKPYQGMAAQIMGEIYLYLDDKHMDEAESWIRKAIEMDVQHKMPWDLARDYALYAEFFKKKSDPAQAKEKLGKAIELMRSCNADGWVKKYEEELAAIS